MRRFPRIVRGIKTRPNMSNYDKTHILHPIHEKAFIDSFLDLYRTNGDHFDKAVGKSSKQKRVVKLIIQIDKSGGMPVFDSTISMVMAEPLKDHRRTTADDPDQFPLPLAQKDPVPVKRAKKKASK